MTKVTREFSFEAAHMLSGYGGQCKNLHGHSYKLQVTVEGSPSHRQGESDAEMVIDFTDLKAIVQEKVIDRVDHAIIFSNYSYRKDAEEELYRWATKYGMKFVELNGRCTAETIAAWIRSTLIRKMGGDIHVRLWETEKSFTEV